MPAVFAAPSIASRTDVIRGTISRCVSPAVVIRYPGAPATLVVRDPRPVTAFDDAALARMKELLAPALHPQPYELYEGYPLRIVKDRAPRSGGCPRAGDTRC